LERKGNAPDKKCSSFLASEEVPLPLARMTGTSDRVKTVGQVKSSAEAYSLVGSWIGAREIDEQPG
jgi:hypothetical protein